MASRQLSKFAVALILGGCGLHPRNALAGPIFVDFGPGKVLTGVDVAPDGTTRLVGYSTDASSGLKNGILETVSADGSVVTTQTLGQANKYQSYQATKIRGNNIVGWGMNAQNQVGLAWAVSDTSQPILTGSIIIQGTSDLTRNLGVNAIGDFAGWTAAGATAILGNISSSSIEQLSSPAGSLAFGNAISAQGYVAGTITPVDSNAILPIVWTDPTTPITLPQIAPGSSESASEATVDSISPLGKIVGGSLGIFDSISETVRLEAAVWQGSDWSNLTLLQNSDGTPFFGQVLGVTDNGYAVGRSDLGGFIWQTGWAAPILFNTWAHDTYGLNIPTWVVSVNDVFYDGTDLSFALQGSAYLVKVPSSGAGTVPEPRTLVLLALASLLLTLVRNFHSNNCNKVVAQFRYLTHQ